MRQPVLCAIADEPMPNQPTATNAIKRTYTPQCDLPCRLESSSFMTSPLIVMPLRSADFFEVAVPRKPYYNAAKLEKASISVKHKEFLLGTKCA